MLNIPESIKTLFQTDGVFKNFRVHFPNGEHADLTNSDIVSESVKFTESICSKEVFQFGLSERSQIEFECVNVPNIYGVTIECGIEIDTSSLSASEIAEIQSGTYDGTLVLEADSDIGFGYYHIPYGVFVVQNCPRSQGAMKHRRVTAYSLQGADNIRMSSFLRYKFSTPIRQLKGVKNMSQNVPILLACNNNDISELQTEETELTFHTVGTTQAPYANWEYDGITYRVRPSQTAHDFKNSEITDWWSTIGNNNLTFVRFTCDIDYAPLEPIINRLEELHAPDEVIKIALAFMTVYYDMWYSQFAFDDPTDTGYIYPFANEHMSRGIVFNDGNITRLEIAKFYTSGVEYEYIDAVGIVSNPQAYMYTLTDTDKALQNIQINATGTFEDLSGVRNTYTDALDISKLTDGYTEIHGQFRRAGRNGNAEYISISKASPVSMTPEEYSELWWDEYDIEPVGTVTATYNDVDAGQEQTVVFPSGTGQSQYLMNDNYFLKNLNVSESSLTGQTLDEYVLSLLESNFIPKLSDIAFTPVTLDAIGLPYLEAGDYLEIDNADGGTVGTYILTRTISGIQTLTDSIESKGGEVMGNGS